MRSFSLLWFLAPIAALVAVGCSPAPSGSGKKSDAGTSSDGSTGGTTDGTTDGGADGGESGSVDDGGSVDGVDGGPGDGGDGGPGDGGPGDGGPGDGGDGGPGDGGPGDGGDSSGDPSTVDPQCTDGKYSEPLPDASASISDLLAGYSPAAYQQFVIDVLDRRYPFGAFLVEQTANKGVNGTTQNCTDFFLQSFGTGSASQVMSGLSTVVHECGHVYDTLDLFNPVYQVTEALSFSCKDGGAGGQFGFGKTFARSLLNGDEYAALHTPCKSFGDNNCEDSYAGIYLNGDPNDASFDSGDQGFDTVLEEAFQYVNSLAVAYAYQDQANPFGASSDRDGILTFLWYVQRYLRMARLEYPQAYQLLSGTPCWRDAILTLWGRAWLFLDATSGIPGLGIQDAKIEGLVLYPELIEEIDLLREASGCP